MGKSESATPWHLYPKNMGECLHLDIYQNLSKCNYDPPDSTEPCDWTPEGCHMHRPYTEQELADIRERLENENRKDAHIVEHIIRRGMRKMASFVKYLSDHIDTDGFSVYKEYRLDESVSNLHDVKVRDLSTDNKLQLILYWLSDPVTIGVYNERNTAEDILELIDDESFERRVINKYFRNLHITIPEED